MNSKTKASDLPPIDPNAGKSPKKMPASDIDRELQKLLESHKTVIKVFGTGGAGNNTVSRLMQIGLEDVETYAVNTDAQDLLFAHSDYKVLIGRNITNGLGAGSDPAIGEESARENQDELKELLTRTDLVFVTCGLGGGTGTGSAPILAELAREAGALTISIVTLPFSEEGILRWNNARFGLEKLRKNSDTLIVIQNDKLWEIAPEIPLEDAFKVADEILVNAVKGITELVTKKGLVNLDFADIRTIMKDGGTALIGMAESDSPNRSVEAVERAIENPLIELDINGAKNALLNITGGKDMTIKDAKVAMQTLAQKLDKSARIIWGSRVNPELENKVRVMVIATGLRDYTTDKLFRSPPFELGQRISRKNSESAKGTPPTEGEEVQKIKEPEGRGEPVLEESKREARKIFREIVEEEADADLKILRDDVDFLKKKPDHFEKWQELSHTFSSLTGTAQMFDFHEIAELTSGLEDFIYQVMEKNFFIPEVLDFLQEVPEQLQNLIQEVPEGEKWRRSFGKKVTEMVDFLKNRMVVSVDSFREKLGEVRGDTPSERNPSTKMEKDANPVDVAVTEEQDRHNGDNKSGFKAVNDVVKYVDNLFRGEPKSSKVEE